MSIGKSIRRLDAAAKVTGRARYTEDLKIFGTKHAAYVRSSIAHGIVKNIDVSKAEKIKGVRAVFTYKDVPDIIFGTAGHPYTEDKDHKDVADRKLLTNHVRYVGDEIAVVVADTELIARKAAAAAEVEYQQLEIFLTPDKILAPDVKLIHEIGNIVGAHSFVVGGDIDKAIKKSKYIAQSEYKTAMVCHCHLENHITYAYMEDNENIIIVSSTQIPHIARRIVSEALNFPLGRIKVIKPYIGGGFGNKQDVILEPMAAFLTLKLNGAPIQISLTREECFTSTRARHPFYGKLTGGVSNDGKLTFLDMDIISLTGAYASHGHSVASAGGAKSCTMYPRAAIKLNAKTVYSNMPAAGAMRAYGTPQTVFMIESLIEELARKSNADSVEFRLKNVGIPNDINPLNNQVILTDSLKETLEKGRKLIDWDRKKRLYAADTNQNIKRGLGVACFSYASGTYPVCVEIAGARFVLNQDGSVNIQVGATEIGQGSDTVFAQMASETVGINIEKIKVVSTQDTDTTPFDTGSYASRQTYVTGEAIYKTAVLFKAKILKYAQRITKISKNLLDIKKNSVVYKKEADRVVISLKELAKDAYYNKERGRQITAEVSYKTRTNAPSFGSTFVDISADIQLCKVTINEIYNIHDAGIIINPMLAKGQVCGGMGMSIGAALFEKLLIDDKTGGIYNNNLLDYKMPTIMDIGDLKCDFVQTNEPTSSYGVKSLGEPPIISPAPAIRNAIWDATGVKIDQLPITKQVLFKKFKEA
ncbi:MAG: xanthine dehydrogenase molybdenum-binding subunit XdhA, partial [Deltaproteobacteria bacterium]|nr:xanthine dehydrogenase molybdenum-binding subunit XdhA [Deltaproteobacteria bacterium]